ncbi:sulfotransferase [Gemmobacter sp.]|uniref:sulfotransferase n=1 Tax=Gemmobacter sp. TaxID=1898957 RepID=UPI002AFDEF01|nr:sulfotransferase [Gemmobacter sp.]
MAQAPAPSSQFFDLHAPAGGYVFVVTYGRSGSTVVQNLLNAIPGYCIRGENANALSGLARSWHQLNSAEPRNGLKARGTATTPEEPWYGAELVQPWRYGNFLANVFVREVLALPRGTRVGGFKEIRFHAEPMFFPAYMGFIRRFFPKARFIFNTRNHDAVLKSGWWPEMDQAGARAQLEKAEALFAAHVAAHPAVSLHLKYEDYAGNPEGCRPLFDFLGESFDADLVAGVLNQRLDHLQRPPQD